MLETQLILQPNLYKLTWHPKWRVALKSINHYNLSHCLVTVVLGLEFCGGFYIQTLLESSLDWDWDFVVVWLLFCVCVRPNKTNGL